MRRPTGRIAPMSDKRANERDERFTVRASTAARAGHLCEMIDAVPEIRCSGPATDTDEIQGRGVNPGGHLDPSNTQYACRAHHRWKTENPAEARERGLTVRSTFELEGRARRLR